MAYAPAMARRRDLEHTEKVVEYLAALRRERRLSTFGDESVVVFGHSGAGQAIGAIHKQLIRQQGAGHYPGTEWVVTTKGEVVGPVTRDERVLDLRRQGIEVQGYFVSPELLAAHRRRGALT